jgi:hypothetical protein
MNKNTFSLLFLSIFICFIPGVSISQDIGPLETEIFDGFMPCKLFYTDGEIREGFATKPNMKTIYLKFKTDKSEFIPDQIESEKIEKIIFTVNNNEFICRKMKINKKNNKTVSIRTSWLMEMNTGYVSLYFGEIPGYNNPMQPGYTPTYHNWYYKKPDEESAWYISTFTPDVNVMQIDLEQKFMKNTLAYFSDDPELIAKLENKKYFFKDLQKIVAEYNERHEQNY